MRRLFLIFTLIVFQAYSSSTYADIAVLNTQDYTLSLSSVRVTNAGTYQNVILGLTSLGTVATDDISVGNNIEFNPSMNALLLPTVTVGNTTYSKVSLTGLTFDVLSVNGVSTDTAVFNPIDNTLSLSSVRVTNAGKYQNVILRLTSLGTIATDDSNVGYSIEYNPSNNTLLLPSVTVGDTNYLKVSLTGLSFDVLSVNGVSTTPSNNSGTCSGGTAMKYSGNPVGSYTNGLEVCFTGSTTSLTFLDKTLTNPTPNTASQPPFEIYTFTDSAAGYNYEVVYKSGAFYEINVMNTLNSTFYGQFAP